MVQKRTLTLADDERQALVEHRDHDPRPQARERCATLLKIADGESPQGLSQRGLLKPRSPDTVYHWLDLYEMEGLEGSLRRLHGGRLWGDLTHPALFRCFSCRKAGHNMTRDQDDRTRTDRVAKSWS